MGGKTDSRRYFPSADDLIPLFIYTLLCCNPKRLFSTVAFISTYGVASLVQLNDRINHTTGEVKKEEVGKESVAMSDDFSPPLLGPFLQSNLVCGINNKSNKLNDLPSPSSSSSSSFSFSSSSSSSSSSFSTSSSSSSSSYSSNLFLLCSSRMRDSCYTNLLAGVSFVNTIHVHVSASGDEIDFSNDNIFSYGVVFFFLFMISIHLFFDSLFSYYFFFSFIFFCFLICFFFFNYFFFCFY
jgi:hypothetical protein